MDYDDHLNSHSCEEFPGDDFPIKAYYQHNYVVRRDRNEISAERLQIREMFARNGIDFDSMIKMDQQACEHGEEDILIDEPRPNV